MATFSLTSADPDGEILGAINYILSNLTPPIPYVGNVVVANSTTGQIVSVNSTGQADVVSYIYDYVNVKYSDSADGTVNFSNTQTNRQYFGVRNSTGVSISSNPTDYIWTQVSGGFGTTKTLYYIPYGGNKISFYAGVTPPTVNYIPAPVDTQIFLARPANLIVSTNNIIANAITADKISAGSITSDKIVANAITSDKIAVNTITSNMIQANAIVSGVIASGAIIADKLAAANVITLSAQIQDAVITTAKIGEAQIDTLRIGSNQVTVPVSAYTSGSVSLSGWTTIQSASITSTGAPTIIMSAFTSSSYLDSGGSGEDISIRVYRDSTIIYEGKCRVPNGVEFTYQTSSWAGICADTPSSGSHTYTLQINTTLTTTALYRSLVLLETKR